MSSTPPSTVPVGTAAVEAGRSAALRPVPAWFVDTRAEFIGCDQGHIKATDESYLQVWQLSGRWHDA
jgi:hypothetical protein